MKAIVSNIIQVIDGCLDALLHLSYNFIFGSHLVIYVQI